MNTKRSPNVCPLLPFKCQSDHIRAVFRNKFAAVYREQTPRSSSKAFYVHMTKVTVTDTMRGVFSSGKHHAKRSSMSAVINGHSVCDAILRSNLQSSDLA